MKTVQVALLAAVVGGALGFAAYQPITMLMESDSNSSATETKAADEPLYWVAPMDPNYQRDKPGKSPMGMDLVPVYAEDLASESEPVGTVTINAAVENNLGVKVAPVTLSTLIPHINTVGYVAFDESQLWQTNVRVSGWVEKLNINAVGERVTKGSVLFTLYSPDLVKAQEELLNASKMGRKALIRGATERLVSLGVDREQIATILQRGKASNTIDIKAPANGIIASLNVREGGYLSPAQAAISAGPLNEVWVDAEVFERQSHWIKSGAKAVMALDSLPGQEWQGEVDYIYPILDPTTRTLRVRLKFINQDYALKPNMFANITLQPESESEVLTIPRQAVIQSGGMTRVVLALGDGKYRSVRIETGREANQMVEVLEGLTEQDTVVVSAQFMLDSESSQTAELSRINGVDDVVPSQEAATAIAWANGEITDMMAGHRMLTINHQPVPEWGWPGMVMNFMVAEQVDMSALQSGQVIEFSMQKMASGQYEVQEVKLSNNTVPNEVWMEGDISMLMADFGMITINHQAAPEWNWQPGEMNFTVSDSNNDLDLSSLIEGQKIRFLITKQDNDYLLKEIELVSGGEQ